MFILYLTPLITSGEKIAVRTILCYVWEKKRIVTKEINDMKGPETVNECVTQNWLRCFKAVDTSLKDQPKSARLSDAEDVTLLEIALVCRRTWSFSK